MKLTQVTGATISASNPISVFKGRYKYIYGVHGDGRGFRWDTASTAIEPIGLKGPATAATFGQTSATTTLLASVKLVSGGSGYYEPPSVTFRGGGLTDGHTGHARALAQMSGSGVGGVVITFAGTGYTSNPQVEFSGGRGDGASVSVGYAGRVSACTVVAQGSGYTEGANIVFGGVSGAIGSVNIDDRGRVSGIQIINGGTGATTTATATITGIAGGSGAVIACDMQYTVEALTVTSGGTGYAGTAPVTFTSLDGAGAAAYLTADTSGALASPTITAKGQYRIPPTASIAGQVAVATAMIRPPMKGAYRCCYRYVDETPIDQGGPIPSDISELVTVDAEDGSQAFVWNWSNDGADERAAAVELFRTSANQAVVLYRVALLRREGGVLPTTYTDTLSEAELINPTREGYAYMPITLPSGQLNARRFGVPPSKFADACWFQDRAWYGVDSTGAEPNVLKYSEIDEPESVPETNEIVIQENAGEQDAVTALIPFGSMLVIAQRRHLYRLMYVAQPVIDASITLLGYRGILQKKCWSSFEGTVFAADSIGIYAFDGQNMEPISVPIDNYWRDGIVDLSQASKFFLQADPATRTVRFHYMKVGESGYPRRALCYCLGTKAWWEEEYPIGMGDSCVLTVSGRQSIVVGAEGGETLQMAVGSTDYSASGSTAIPYTLRTGNMPLSGDHDRRIGIVYEPTAQAATMGVQLHYNGQATPRGNAVADARGDGVTAVAGQGAVILTGVSRSPLAPATGYAAIHYSGRVDDRSAGGDRHLAVAITGAKQSAPAVVYSIAVGGVTQ